MNKIEFPELGLSFEIDPILLHYKNGGGIYWYGVIIGIGVLLGLLLCVGIYKRRGKNPEELVDFVLCALPAGIVGARLYYVMFSLDAYKGRPLDVFKTWEGGMAVYGGIIAGLITALIFCRVKQIDFLEFADIAILGVVVGQCIGRWGNFVNGEAHGGETDLPWGMTINGSEPVHPTFFYESLWSLLGLLVLLFLLSRGLRTGSCFFAYLIWYGTGRFFIEGLRTDSLYTAFGLRVSQIVAVVSVICGIAGLVWIYYTKRKSENIKTL